MLTIYTCICVCVTNHVGTTPFAPLVDTVKLKLYTAKAHSGASLIVLPGSPDVVLAEVHLL